MRERHKFEPPQFLSGWKEIANYLGKGVRTVQRYERQLGLPVRRPAGKPWGSVVATRAELDGWVQASPIREVYHLARPLGEYAYSGHEIRQGLSEMQRLREQMLALRAEVQRSVETLRHSLIDLQNELDTSNPHESHTALGANQHDLPGERPLGLLTAPTKYPRAS